MYNCFSCGAPMQAPGVCVVCEFNNLAFPLPIADYTSGYAASPQPSPVDAALVTMTEFASKMSGKEEERHQLRVRQVIALESIADSLRAVREDEPKDVTK